MMNINCPLPQLDFDVITLAHGSGGLLTNRLLNQCIFELFQNPYLNTQDDAAIIQSNGELVISTDSFVVSPIFFPGGNIGDLAVNGTVNDVAMCGGMPQYLSLGLILEEGLTIKELWDVLVSIKMAAEAAGVQIITGDTKVVDKGKGDKIFINTTGIGKKHAQAKLDLNGINNGDQIIISGPIASHGMCIMAEREGFSFKHPILTDSAPLNHITNSMLDRYGNAIRFMRDPTRGGVAAVLNEIVKKITLGIRLFEEKLPILDPVRSLAEILGIDPLYVANEGLFIAVVDQEITDSFLDDLRHFEIGKKAAHIGEVTSDFKDAVTLKSRIGGSRLVHMPLGEQLPRIC
jgi:hydrogenase expression/formation protein HypE